MGGKARVHLSPCVSDTKFKVATLNSPQSGKNNLLSGLLWVIENAKWEERDHLKWRQEAGEDPNLFLELDSLKNPNMILFSLQTP